MAQHQSVSNVIHCDLSIQNFAELKYGQCFTRVAKPLTAEVYMKIKPNISVESSVEGYCVGLSGGQAYTFPADEKVLMVSKNSTLTLRMGG